MRYTDGNPLNTIDSEQTPRKSAVFPALGGRGFQVAIDHDDLIAGPSFGVGDLWPEAAIEQFHPDALGLGGKYENAAVRLARE